MFTLLSSFTFNHKQGYLYRRNENLYYSPKKLEENEDSSKFLRYIDEKLTLSEFILTLN